MKLSLDELEVESYALQVSESELSEVKGGTTWWCAFDIAVAVVGAAGTVYAVYQNYQNANSPNGSISIGSGGGPPMGSGTYVWEADSVKVVNPDGTVIMYYNPSGSTY